MEKRGQITIFIIIAIVIVFAVSFVFLFMFTDTLGFGGGVATNPNIFLKNCIEDDLQNTLETLSYQGGSLNPELAINFQFGNEPLRNIAYLCHTDTYYTPCTSQQPVITNHLKEEIRGEIGGIVSACFSALVEDLEKKNYDVNANYEDFEIDFYSQEVELNILGSLSYEKGDERRTSNDFKISVPTRFYELVKLAQEIASQEAKYCYFERVGHMIYYPNIEIEPPFILDDTKIYTLRHEKTKEAFRFAIRSCAIPEGLF